MHHISLFLICILALLTGGLSLKFWHLLVETLPTQSDVEPAIKFHQGRATALSRPNEIALAKANKND